MISVTRETKSLFPGYGLCSACIKQFNCWRALSLISLWFVFNLVIFDDQPVQGRVNDSRILSYLIHGRRCNSHALFYWECAVHVPKYTG